MSKNEINNRTMSIKNISDYILSDQSLDIKAYTTGHLNESHLYRPPEQKLHQPWGSANLESPKSKTKIKTLDISLDTDDDSAESMFNTLVEFSIGDKITGLAKLNRSANYINDPKKFKSAPKSAKLPILTVDQENQIKNFNFLLTDKELAINSLTSPFNGATKQEKFKNFAKFEKNVIRKDDTLVKNVLHATDSSQVLEKKLENVKNAS